MSEFTKTHDIEESETDSAPAIEKRCVKCLVVKPINEFRIRSVNNDGRDTRCVVCAREIGRIQYKINPEKYRKKTQLRRELYPEKIRLWQTLNKDKIREAARARQAANQAANPEKAREAQRRYREKNREKIRLRNRMNPEAKKLWRKAHPDKIKEMGRTARKKRRATPHGRLNCTFSFSVWHSIRSNKKGRRWETLVGYTLDQLKKHLEKRFKEGMAWENYGQWHIDHIIPVSVFNFEKPEDDDFKRCWSLKNLQPLWAKENAQKHNKINRHFQPKLIFNKTI